MSERAIPDEWVEVAAFAAYTADMDPSAAGELWNTEGDVIRERYLTEARAALAAVVEALGLREVHTIAWDGEPSMSGRAHRRSAGTESPPGALRELLGNAAWVRGKPGARMERRWVTEWEEVDE